MWQQAASLALESLHAVGRGLSRAGGSPVGLRVLAGEPVQFHPTPALHPRMLCAISLLYDPRHLGREGNSSSTGVRVTAGVSTNLWDPLLLLFLFLLQQ